MKTDIRNLSLPELGERFKSLGLEPYRAKQVTGWIYDKGVESFAQMSNLPQSVKDLLKQEFSLMPLSVVTIQTSRDLTQKFLFSLRDQHKIESVSIPAKSRLTVCLSTQVGCRFGCAFCASGASGFRRNLETSEIVAQFFAIRRHVPEQRVTNIVFMGIGEPLDNYDNLLKAVRILNSPDGAHFGIRRMTVSTCGLVPQIQKLAEEGLELELSISLHSALDAKRDILVPANKIYPVHDVIGAARAYIKKTQRKVTFEYVLLGGYNTALDDAQALVRVVRGMNARVNIIPYNPGKCRAAYVAPTKLEVLFFKSYLAKAGLDVTLRMPRGEDISAACGQLRSQLAGMEKK